MNEEWEDRLYKLIDEDYDIEDLVGVCKTARRNGFVAGIEKGAKAKEEEIKSEVLRVISDDVQASAFQTTGQYRSWLLKKLA